MELVVLFLFSAGFWLLLIRPQQQRLRAQRDLIASLEVGDRIVTAGGLIGTIVHLDDRDADVSVAPGVVLKFLRPAISRRLEDDDAGASAGTDDIAGTDAGAAALGATAGTDVGAYDAGALGAHDAGASTDAGAHDASASTDAGAHDASASTDAAAYGAPPPAAPRPPSAGDDDIEEGT